MALPKTLQEAILYFADFDDCKAFLMELRWPDGKVTCPRCGAEKVTWLSKARVWKCYGKHESPTFSLKTGTGASRLRTRLNPVKICGDG